MGKENDLIKEKETFLKKRRHRQIIRNVRMAKHNQRESNISKMNIALHNYFPLSPRNWFSNTQMSYQAWLTN